MAKKLLLCLIFILSFSLVFADEPWLEMFDTSTSHYGSISSIIAVVLLLATIVTTIIWMAGNFFNHEGIKASAKMEVFEIAYSGVLFVFLFSMFGTFDGMMAVVIPDFYITFTPLIDGLTADPSTGYETLPVHFRYSKFFLNTLFNEAVRFNEVIFSSYSKTGILADIYISMDLFWEQRSFINYNPTKGLFHMGNIIKSQVFDYVTKIALIARFQEVLLHMIVSSIFPIFLGSGIILRSFKVTRKLGGLMMAIAIALYFVFPLFYVFAGGVFDHVGGIGTLNITGDAALLLMDPLNSVRADTDEETLDALNTRYGTNYGEVEQALEDISQKGVCDLLSMEENTAADDAAHSDVESGVMDWYSNFKRNSISVTAASDAYFDIPARLIFFSMFFSFFGLMATVAAIRNLSAVFGGDLEIAGLTHLI